MLVPRGFHSKLDSVQCRILKVPSASREIPISLWGLHMLLSFEYNEDFLLAGSGPDPFSKLTSWHISENDGPAPPSRRLHPGGVAAPALSRRRRDLHCPRGAGHRLSSSSSSLAVGGKARGLPDHLNLQSESAPAATGHSGLLPPSRRRAHCGIKVVESSRLRDSALARAYYSLWRAQDWTSISLVVSRENDILSFRCKAPQGRSLAETASAEP